MNKRTKIWLISAASLLLIGAIIFTGAMAILNWDFTKLSTNKYVVNEYKIEDSFKNISIITDTADVLFVPSDTPKVICCEQANLKHTVTVQDDTLVIEMVDTRKWYEYIGIGFKSTKITVNIPKGEYGALEIKNDTGDVQLSEDFSFEDIDVSESTGTVTCYADAQRIKIKTDTGSICVKGITVDTLDLSVSTGRTELTDINCTAVTSKGSTGNITLKNVIAKEKFTITRSTGDVKFDSCDASEIFVEVDTGDIKGSLLSEKVFIAKSDTGRVNVPKTTSGGKCELYADTGDIKITVQL